MRVHSQNWSWSSKTIPFMKQRSIRWRTAYRWSNLPVLPEVCGNKNGVRKWRRTGCWARRDSVRAILIVRKVNGVAVPVKRSLPTSWIALRTEVRKFFYQAWQPNQMETCRRGQIKNPTHIASRAIQIRIVLLKRLKWKYQGTCKAQLLTECNLWLIHIHRKGAGILHLTLSQPQSWNRSLVSRWYRQQTNLSLDPIWQKTRYRRAICHH